MKTIHVLPFVFAALLTGCQTPPAVKELSKTTRAESAKINKSYQDDLEKIAAYLQAYDNAVANLSVNASRTNANTEELLKAWKAVGELNVKLCVVALWDERAMKILTQEFPQFQLQEYWPRINAKLQPMRAESRAHAQAATGSNNSALSFEEARSVARVAETEHQAASELIKLYDQLNADLARGRVQLLQDLGLEKTAFATPAAPALQGPPATVTPADPATDPVLVKLSERRKEVADVAAAQDEALQAIDYYLQNDGYSRVLAKEALTGLAAGLVSETKGVLKVDKLPDQVAKVAASLGLTSDAAQKQVKDFTEKVTSSAVASAQTGLEQIFTSGLARIETYATAALGKLKDGANAAITRVETKASTP